VEQNGGLTAIIVSNFQLFNHQVIQFTSAKRTFARQLNPWITS